MTSNAVRAEARDYGRSRAELIERGLREFRPKLQEPVCLLARRHPRLADLVISFPALLANLAVPGRGVSSALAIEQTIAGRPLADIIAVVDLPNWLQRLRPALVPEALPRLPNSPMFRRMIANHLPRSPRTAPAWFKLVGEAAAWGDERLAVWTAREYLRDAKAMSVSRLRLVCLWAWFCGAQETRGHSRITQVWNPSMRFSTARDAARQWLETLLPELDLGDGDVADVWLDQTHFLDHDFIPLRSAADIRADAFAMNHCVQRYTRSLVHDYTRLWSVRHGGERLATAAIGYRYNDSLPVVTQLRGPKNAKPSRELAWVVRRWLNAHDLLQVEKTERDDVPLNRAAWVSLWRPYWLAKRRFAPWLPLAPNRVAIERLDS